LQDDYLEHTAMTKVAARLTVERGVAKYTGGRDRPSWDEIARLAYSFYETRGRRHGQDVDDWLSAEQELMHHYQIHG
jgi:Protein of unknown function (DUF2934)